MKQVVIHVSRYADVAEGGTLLEHLGYTSTVPCEPDEFDREDGLTAVDLAVKAITERAYADECSSSPWQPGAWYCRADEPDQSEPGEVEHVSTSAHVEGFTAGEERAIAELIGSPVVTF